MQIEQQIQALPLDRPPCIFGNRKADPFQVQEGTQGNYAGIDRNDTG